MTALLTRLNAHLRPERGSTLAEYALIISIVSIVAVALLQSIGASVIDLLDDITFG